MQVENIKGEVVSITCLFAITFCGFFLGIRHWAPTAPRWEYAAKLGLGPTMIAHYGSGDSLGSLLKVHLFIRH